MRPDSDAQGRLRVPDLHDEQGIALVVAVLALVVIGALVAGTFFAGRLEQRGGLNSLHAAQAFEAAEAGMATTLAGWTPSALNARPIGVDTVLPVGSLGGGNGFTTTVTRLNPTLFYIRSEGQRRALAGDTLARRTLGLLVRVDPPIVDTSAALTAAGGVTVADASVLDGHDHLPPGWGPLCPPLSAAVAPIQSDSGDVKADSGSAPPVVVNDTLGAATFQNFGSATFDQLAAVAGLQVGGTLGSLAPSLRAGGPPRSCNASDRVNWGEPRTGAGSIAPCFGYFPLIYAPADLALTGGRGQGTLLVRGDLDLSGGVELFGVVIVLGRVTTSGAGGTVFGTLLVAGGSPNPSAIGSGSLIGYSSCAVRRALSGAAFPRPLGSRSWLQLY
jgi:hypothetical protein